MVQCHDNVTEYDSAAPCRRAVVRTLCSSAHPLRRATAARCHRPPPAARRLRAASYLLVDGGRSGRLPGLAAAELAIPGRSCLATAAGSLRSVGRWPDVVTVGPGARLRAWGPTGAEDMRKEPGRQPRSDSWWVERRQRPRRLLLPRPRRFSSPPATSKRWTVGNGNTRLT